MGAPVIFRDSPCETGGGQTGNGAGLLSVLRDSPVSIISIFGHSSMTLSCIIPATGLQILVTKACPEIQRTTPKHYATPKQQIKRTHHLTSKHLNAKKIFTDTKPT